MSGPAFGQRRFPASSPALPMVAAAMSLVGCSQAPPPIRVFPPPPAEPQLVYLGRLDQAPIDAPPRLSLRRWLGDLGGFLTTPLQRPFGMCAVGTRLYVCDPPTSTVVVFDYDRQDTSVIGGLGKPVAISAAADGRLFIADAGSGRIHVRTADGRGLPPIEPPGPGIRPAALAVDSSRIWVADPAGRALRAIDLNSRQWSEPFAAEPEPGFPAGVCVRGSSLWMSDALTGLLWRGELTAGRLTPWATSVRRSRPKQIAVDEAGRVYVTDAVAGAVQVIDEQGGLRCEVRDASVLPLPSGVCLSRELAGHYRGRLPPGFDAGRMLFVSNQSAPPGVAVFAAR